MVKKISNYILTLSFLTFISLFAIVALLDHDKDSSALEGKKYEQKPVFSLDGLIDRTFLKSFETYFSDQFPLRDNWIETNNYISTHLFRNNLIKGVYTGDSDYLISVVNSTAEDKVLNQSINKINDFAATLKPLDIPIYFALVPNKSTMMEEKLPKHIESYANEYSDSFIAGLSNQIHSLDLRKTLLPHLQEENMYFYTDHHWKPKAAFYAYQEIINTLNEKDKSIGVPLKISDFNWQEDQTPFYGSEARKVTKLNVNQYDTITIVTKKDEEAKIDIRYGGISGRKLYDYDYLNDQETYTNRYAAYLSGDKSEIVMKNPSVKNGKRVLIMKDSYANPMIQFFTNHFEEVRVLDLRHYNRMSVKEYIAKHNIHYALFVHNINSISTTPSLFEF